MNKIALVLCLTVAMHCPTYIIHVQGNKERKLHMEKLLAKFPILEPNYINQGNISDLEDEVLHTYFKGEMAQKQAVTSCAYKHLLALQSIANLDGWGMVLEDDIKFYSNFNDEFGKVLNEIKIRNIGNAIISLEDSLPRYIPKNELIKGTLLYSRKEMRLAGAYLIDHLAAKNILSYVSEHKIHLTADWFYSFLIQENVLSCYWSQPAIACQKSISGSLPSLIDRKKQGVFRQLSFFLQRQLKKIRSKLNH